MQRKITVCKMYNTYIGFNVIIDLVHSILQYPTVMFSDILQYIVRAMLYAIIQY